MSNHAALELFQMLYRWYHLIFTILLGETIIISVLKMRKLKHREVT